VVCSLLGRVPALSLRVGLFATSPHSLRSLRAFRCYPSRRYARVHVRYTHTR